MRFVVLTFLIGTIFGSALSASAQSEAYFEFTDPPSPDTFIFKLTDPARIQEARDIIKNSTPKLISGVIIKQPVYYNPAWSYHFDPKTVGFVDAAMELCDSTMRGIENNLDGAFPAWCPWGSQLLREVTPPPPPSGNIIPTISFTDPYSNDTYGDRARANVVLRVNADDPDGSITKVEFFNGATKIGETSTFPYAFNWNNLGSGTYTVSAIATDNQGATRASKSVRFSIIGLEDTYFFVTQQYQDFLNRWPDSNGLFFWTGNIYSCGTDQSCIEVKRIDTSAAFFLSIEFQETGYWVHRFYKASFGRRVSFAEFVADHQAVANGVIVNTPDWEQRLETNKQTFLNAWVTREAFTSIYNGLSNEQYVDTLIANTGATFSTEDRDALVRALNENTSTRAQVLRSIVENRAFYNAEYNAAFVEMEYFGYLRRDPDTEGFTFWLNKLNEHNGDFRRAEMVKSFLVSGEYQSRFSN